MTWENIVCTLDCGCKVAGYWDVQFPGDMEICATHGKTHVKRVSRIREVSAGVRRSHAQEPSA